MGRFHRHDDGTEHDHPAGGHGHGHGHGHDAEHDPTHTPGPAYSDSATSTHGDHSGYGTGGERVQVLERIFDENDRCAAENRSDLDGSGTIAINLMSSPGAGKTTLLQHTLRELEGKMRVAVIEGDIETSIDADRLTGFGAHIELVNTGDGFGGECHLDAPMVRSALVRMPLDQIDLTLIENVGNLVCPAEFSVGEHAKAMIYAITEGEEKPLKYPVMFRAVDVVLINKIDLLPYLDFDLAQFRSNLKDVNPTAHVIEVSAKTGEGVQEWVQWVLERHAEATAS